jgi:PHD/YefM family antitoxin component YafN of YafNO toxin-antitoxin module
MHGAVCLVICTGGGPAFVDEKGKKTAVILSIEKYEELLEDLHDLSIIAERQYEPTIAFEDLKKELKEDRIL